MMGRVRHGLCLALAVVLVSGSARLGTADSAASHGPGIRVGDVTPSWLRIDPQQPRTLFLGGDTWAERSDDGGSTWHYLADFVPVPIGASPSNTAIADTLTPLVVEPGATRLYTWGMSSVGHGSAFVLGSRDGGATWSRLDPGEPERLYMMPSVSPLSAQRLYALEFFENTSLVISSADGGATWREDGADPGVLQIDLYNNILPLPPIPDPQAVDTVYADGSGSVARSEDAGLTWTAVVTPTTTLTKFTVGIDPYRPGRIVARGPGVSPQRWVSADHGRTWSDASCSGVLGGTCPLFTVDNVFGAGRSYAFFPDGIHPFTADGPSGPRLDLSNQLPMPIAQLLDVRAGTHAGDPVYLLGKVGTKHIHGSLYRSSDGGKHWDLLTGWLPPTLAPAAPGPAGLLVPQTHHRVAAAFVATYRRIGQFVLGYPVDEAYTPGKPKMYVTSFLRPQYLATIFATGASLVQDFEHMRLEVRGGQVHIVALGREDDPTLLPSGPPSPNQDTYPAYDRVKPVPTTPSLRYFAATGHTVRGKVLSFWQANGGVAVFGLPLSELYTARNSDGSGRSYQMQFFENARIELHPENSNPRYSVLLGALGEEMLLPRGWTSD